MSFIVWNNHLLMKRLYFDEISFLLEYLFYFFILFLYLFFYAIRLMETGAFHLKWKANLMITFKIYSIQF